MNTCCQTPWLGVRLLAPFVTPLRETLEMLYLWTQEVCLDNAKIVGFLGAEPHTPIHEGLRCTLEGQGSLRPESPARALRTA
jgi:hypothetical protein